MIKYVYESFILFNRLLYDNGNEGTRCNLKTYLKTHLKHTCKVTTCTFISVVICNKKSYVM